MSYLSRACMAASVAVVEAGHADHFSSGAALHCFQNHNTSPQELIASKIVDARIRKVVGIGHDDEAEDSLRKVMYLNCWTQT